jgi:hypothetical protein
MTVTVVLQWCCSGVTLMIQWWYNGDTMVIQWCYSGVTVVLQWCYSGVTVELIDVPREQRHASFSVTATLLWTAPVTLVRQSCSGVTIVFQWCKSCVWKWCYISMIMLCVSLFSVIPRGHRLANLFATVTHSSAVPEQAWWNVRCFWVTGGMLQSEYHNILVQCLCCFVSTVMVFYTVTNDTSSAAAGIICCDCDAPYWASGEVCCACCSGIAMVLQWCYSYVTIILQWCYSGIKVLLQYCYSYIIVVSRKHHFLWLWRSVLGKWCSVLRLLQWCHSGVKIIWEWCYSCVTVVLQLYCSRGTVILQWCYSGVTAVLQWNHILWLWIPYWASGAVCCACCSGIAVVWQLYCIVSKWCYKGIIIITKLCYSGVTIILQ